MLTRISSTALLIKTGKKLDKLKQPPSCKRWGFFIGSQPPNPQRGNNRFVIVFLTFSPLGRDAEDREGFFRNH